MSGHLMDLDVPKCGTMDRRKCPDAVARAAFDNYIGYWGRYELPPGAGMVIHHVEGASHPDWIGSDQRRFFRAIWVQCAEWRCQYAHSLRKR